MKITGGELAMGISHPILPTDLPALGPMIALSMIMVKKIGQL